MTPPPAAGGDDKALPISALAAAALRPGWVSFGARRWVSLAARRGAWIKRILSFCHGTRPFGGFGGRRMAVQGRLRCNYPAGYPPSIANDSPVSRNGSAKVVPMPRRSRRRAICFFAMNILTVPVDLQRGRCPRPITTLSCRSISFQRAAAPQK